MHIIDNGDYHVPSLSHGMNVGIATGAILTVAAFGVLHFGKRTAMFVREEYNYLKSKK